MGVREDVTARIVKAMEGGTLPWRAGWASTNGPPTNLLTKRPYTGVNRVILALSEHAGGDARWLTFNQSQKLGYKVRKGEKSTAIVRMVEVERREQKADDAANTIAVERDRLLVMRFFHVFNAGQIEGIPPLASPARTIEPVEAAECILEGMKKTGLTIIHGAHGASYHPHVDTVRLPPRSSFFSVTDFYSTALHEVCHATGATHRLARLTPSCRFGTPEYAREELCAEISSAWLCCETGIPLGQHHVESHASYLSSWLRILADDKNEIFHAAATAQGICDYLHKHSLTPESIPQQANPEPMRARPAMRL